MTAKHAGAKAGGTAAGLLAAVMGVARTAKHAGITKPPTKDPPRHQTTERVRHHR